MPSDEKPTTWGRVVESDEIYSAKTDKWYPVTQSVTSVDGAQVKVWARGIPKPITKDSADPVMVRRGATGRAVDVFAVVFSGATARENIGMGITSRPIPERVDDQISESEA